MSNPDTFGLPEYFISTMLSEADGPNVRVICGVTRGGETQWLFSFVMRADFVVFNAEVLKGAAKEGVIIHERAGVGSSNLN